MNDEWTRTMNEWTERQKNKKTKNKKQKKLSIFDNFVNLYFYLGEWGNNADAGHENTWKVLQIMKWYLEGHIP